MRLLLIAIAAVFPAGLQAQEERPDSLVPRPVAPVVIRNACPFECCHYGQWQLRTPAALRTHPRDSARITGLLPSGRGVTADSGIVVVTQVGLVVVRRSYREPYEEEAYAAGDTLLLLDYVGEGFYNIWRRGRMKQAAAYWDRADTSAAQLLVELESQWWAYITAPSGRRLVRGWVDMRETSVAGADACG